jgi:hypothetical protein
MRPRDSKLDLIGYTFDLDELVIIKSALDNTAVRAFIQTARTNYITEHLMTPLSTLQAKGLDMGQTTALEEAYLKGVMDFAASLLESINLPGEENNGT